jgi:hypothetical protein
MSLLNDLKNNPPGSDIPIYDDEKKISENFFNSVVKPTVIRFMRNRGGLVTFKTYSAFNKSLNKHDKNTIPVYRFQNNFEVDISEEVKFFC